MKRCMRKSIRSKMVKLRMSLKRLRRYMYSDENSEYENEYAHKGQYEKYWGGGGVRR
jgi:hypothetical protein